MKLRAYILLGLTVAVYCNSGNFAIADATDRSTAILLWKTLTEYRERLYSQRQNLSETDFKDDATNLSEVVKINFPAQYDWILQDFGDSFFETFIKRENLSSALNNSIRKVIEEISARGKDYILPLVLDKETESSLFCLYIQMCETRRELRLSNLIKTYNQIVFTKRRTIRPSFFAYTEGQSDAQNERHFLPGSSLCILEYDGKNYKTRVLLDDPNGMIRDPAVTWDGKFILFAWKKSLNDDDYHIYELNPIDGKIRQITFGKGFADYEPAPLPNGDIIFSSTRCVQTVDCWWTEVSNLYTCNKDGKYLRRLGFDQVHTVFPTVLEDGRVIYTRWDYNDRGQIFPQALFQMNPDGTGQTEFYGNNSWFPTTITHARGIPGTEKVVAIFCGHHTSQAGKLGIIDPSLGRHENKGARLIAPICETRAERIDAYGQEGELFQYPYPINEHEFIVTYASKGWNEGTQRRNRRGDADFGIYWFDIDGRRELLFSDPEIPCSQPVPLVKRNPIHLKPSFVDYRKTNGTYYIQDIYAGPGLAGVPRGTIKKVRVVGLDFRAAGVGNNSSSGPGGGALISTPISIGNGSWDVKIVIGDAEVYEDGSSFFIAPARTPLYFQALDAKNRAVQTMRSWTTLMPGENQSCVGCHEHKNTAPKVSEKGFTTALKKGAQELKPFYGQPRGFSFTHEIQPILDKHCVHCHNNQDTFREMVILGNFNDEIIKSGRTNNVFSLLANKVLDNQAKRFWTESYLVLTQARPPKNKSDGAFTGNPDGKFVKWISSQSVPTPLPPYFAGSTQSHLIRLLDAGHYEVNLSQEEFDKLACWIDLLVPYCGDYIEANGWNEKELNKYLHYLNKRKSMEEIERNNIIQLLIDTANSTVMVKQD